MWVGFWSQMSILLAESELQFWCKMIYMTQVEQ
jgi:hypothetical protein